MSIGERFTRSWNVVKLSWHVLMADKELLVFPVLSFVFAALLFIALLLPSMFFMYSSLLAANGGPPASIGDQTAENFLYIGMFAWYFVCYLVTVFFSGALVACVRKRLQGGDPTVMYGIREAFKHFGALLGWAVIQASVGILLRMLSSSASRKGGALGFIGVLITQALGFAWLIVTMFVVPAIIFEQSKPFAAIKRSAQLLKQTWGERLILVAGMNVFFGYLYGALFVFTMLSILAAIALSPVFIVITVLCIVCFFVAILFSSTLTGIFNTVLYSYANGGPVPPEFAAVAKEALGPANE